MAVPAGQNLIKAVFTGTRNGGEEWQTGCWIDWVGPVDQAGIDTACVNISGLWATAWTSIKPYVSNDTSWNSTRAYLYFAGTTTAAVVSEHLVAPVPGTSPQHLPYQCGTVASLRTGVPSRRGRGRMYLPTDGFAVSGAGQYSGAGTTDLCHAVASFMTAVNTFVPAQMTAVVFSDTGSATHPITSVIVDSVPDIQRRRANKLVPTQVITTAV